VPPHAVHVVPQAMSVLQTSHTPALHAWFGSHDVALHTHVSVMQSGVVPLHAAQVGPQCWAVSHGAQAPASQKLPAAQSVSAMHSMQKPLGLQVLPIAVQSSQVGPQCVSTVQGVQTNP
jgi:hypothetical protein